MPSALIPVIVVVAAIVLAIVLFRLMWRISEPNEAMIISGRGSKTLDSDTLGPRIITGRGTFVFPGIEHVRFLKLDQHKADLSVECVTSQGIPVHILGVVMYKIANDLASIANAAQRYLGQEQGMDGKVHDLFSGHLRAIVGKLTVEDLISNREKLESETRETCAIPMQKLGFVLDNLNIHDIEDPTRYIESLAKPHLAQVTKAARIAQAVADQEAAQREAEAKAIIAEAQRDSNIKQAGFTAEVERAQATASQAGPLAEATARQAVVTQETQIADLTAQKTEAELNATVKKRADADKYATIARAEAERQAAILGAEANAQATKLTAQAHADQTRLVGEAEGAAITAKGRAEGEALKARAEGLAANQDAVIAQQIAEKLPQVVEAAATAFNGIDHMTVLNGAEGIMDILTQVISQGSTVIDTLRHTNGRVQQPGEPLTGMRN